MTFIFFFLLKPKPPKKHKHKKHKTQPINVANEVEDTNLVDNEADVADNNKMAERITEDDNIADQTELTDKQNMMEPKKIIIEDFVEITTKVSKEVCQNDLCDA